MIPIAKPLLSEEEIDAVAAVLRSGVIAEGVRVHEFEEEFAAYTGIDYAVAVNSGTAALYAALVAHGIGKGDEVITTPFTFIATSNSILLSGAAPVFADIDENTFAIDPDSIVDKITSKTKAIIPVHLYGHPADMTAISDIAEDYSLMLIEDACQAHGAEFEGRRVGSFGTGTFSFYPTKNMTTGEGGMITTNDRDVAEGARMIRSHGSKQRYLHEMFGFNLRMTDISAAIGLVQLKQLDGFTRRRQMNAEYLTKYIRNIDGIVTPKVSANCRHVYHQYTVRITDDLPFERDDVAAFLNENGVGTGIYYPIPIHKQPYYKEIGYDDSFPVSEKVSEQVLSLPVHPGVSEPELEHICGCLTKLVES